LPNKSLIFIMRSLNLTKTYTIMGLFFTAFGAFFFGEIILNAPDSVYILTSAGFSSFGILFFATPIILLYVYDKNNGVLEYLLSLGWNQSDVFKRYLKSALLLTSILFSGVFAVDIIVSFFAGALRTGIVTLVIIAALSFSAVSLVTIAMMAFSSLQKQRVGANSPLALTLGVVVILPTYYTPLIFSFGTSILIDFIIAGLAGAISIMLLFLSGRLIRREKMLP
jgi:hypothetical protein